MNIIITGGTGMIGGLLLKACLDSGTVRNVISFVRKSTGMTHNKLNEVVIDDFEDYSAHDALFKKVDSAFFCIGVYTGKVEDSLFKKITVDYAVKFAKAIKHHSPNARYCLLSGAGADNTEKSRTAFAKYKGMAENQIDALGLEFYTFRPGYIYPVTKRQEPNMMYTISRTLYPLIKHFGKYASIKSTDLATGMFYVGLRGTEKSVLENNDILDLLS